MSAMDFPSNPVDGQVSGNFVWSASTGAWKGKPSVSTVTIHSATAPTAANPGDVWFNTNNGLSFTYFDDGTSKQWVEMVSSAMPAVSTIMPSGTIVQTARATAPDSWLICDGSAVSRTTYSVLYAAIGTQYGSGDGSTTFNIPNLQGKVPVGKDSGTFNALGATGGAETVTLTAAQIPAHSHPNTLTDPGHNHTQNSHNHTQDAHSHGGVIITGGLSVPNGSYYGVWGNYGLKNTDSTTATNQATTATNNANYTGMSITNANNTGGGGSHNNLQPYLVLNYMIKV